MRFMSDPSNLVELPVAVTTEETPFATREVKQTRTINVRTGTVSLGLAEYGPWTLKPGVVPGL